MTVAILDTTVILHLFRKHMPALVWLSREQVFSITSITWMEGMIGVANKRAQTDTLHVLSGFELIYLTQADQEWYHWHLEIIPKLTKMAGFEWGTGFFINPTPPEEAAEYMRGIK